MADRYFVGNGVAIGANWNRTANWSAASGGGGGASVPGGGDNAYLDGNSGDCILDAAASPGELDTTGYGNTLTTGAFTLAIGGGGLTHAAGTIVNSSTVTVAGAFTVAGTWTNSQGTIAITANCAWNATVTTEWLRWETPNTTITMTAANTITVEGELYIIGDQTNDVTVTCGGNYTIDLGASIRVKDIAQASLDNMQLGAGDTVIAYFSTDNGNNDADITFTANTDKTGSVSGQWSNAATWGGAGAPTNGETWSVDLGVTVTLEGDTNELSTGFVYGTLTMDGQTDGTPTPARLIVEAATSIVIIGTLNTANVDDTGFTSITNATGGGTKVEVGASGAGAFAMGASMVVADICLCSLITLAAGEKMSLEGEIDLDGGLTVEAASEFYMNGNPMEVESGNMIFDGTHTLDGTITFEGTHDVSGTSLTMGDVVVG